MMEVYAMELERFREEQRRDAEVRRKLEKSLLKSFWKWIVDIW